MYARKRFPISRIGYEGAFDLLTNQGYTLVGRELISPRKPVVHGPGRFQYSNPGGNAEYHITTKTAERLREALKKTNPEP